MLYKTFGQSGTDVSAIGFGGMRFKNQDDVDQCASLVTAAYEAGINYFDTAIGYGKSEDLFGVAFKEMKKTRAGNPFYVATKTGQTDPQKVREECERSLERMGLDAIDFYHVWCVLSLDKYNRLKANGVLKEFEKLKDEGLVRHVCVSTHMTGPDIGEMLKDYPFEGVLLGYSVMNFAYREAGLDAAANLNRGVVVMNPLGGGLIPTHADRFAFVKTRESETVVEGALRFLINDPRITVALVGLSTEEQLAEAISAVNGFREIPSGTLAEIRRGLNKSFNRMCTSCQYCDNCPRGIPVPRMMESYNLSMLEGGPVGMLNRLRWHWGIPPDSDCLSACVECGECEVACTQKLPIMERLKGIAAEAEQLRAEQAAKG